MLTATKLDGLVVTKVNEITQTLYEYFGLPILRFLKHPRTWGEARVVKNKKTSAKLMHKRTTCLMADHADKHEGDCYIIWEPENTQHSH